MVHQEYLSLLTKGHGDIHNLTGKIGQIVQKAGIRTGMVNVFNVGSTGVIEAIEDLEKWLPQLLR